MSVCGVKRTHGDGGLDGNRKRRAGRKGLFAAPGGRENPAHQSMLIGNGAVKTLCKQDNRADGLQSSALAGRPRDCRSYSISGKSIINLCIAADAKPNSNIFHFR
jgi:hypothetical protein